MAPSFSKRALALGGGGFTGYLFEIVSSYPFVDKELMRKERLHVIDCLRLIKCFRVREIDEVSLGCVVNSLRNAAEGGVEWWD